jgi:two-component sensor histidine kinase
MKRLDEQCDHADEQSRNEDCGDDGDEGSIAHGRQRSLLPVSSIEGIARERTDASDADIAHLSAVTQAWGLLADLSQADLVLWLPTWNGAGYVAAAHVRPTTAPTMLPEEIIGQFTPKGRDVDLDRAAGGGIVGDPGDPRAIAVPGVDSRVVAIVARHAQPVNAGLFHEVYARVSGILFQMLSAGTFPPSGAGVGVSARLAPRVGDGVITVDAEGRVDRASPNAVSAFRRLGLATDLVGADLARTVVRLSSRIGPVDASIAPLASGRVAGMVEIEGNRGSLIISSWPLIEHHTRTGALVCVRDVTDLRSRDRALLSKDAALREVHHRVKNNLQTVAALLRLQSRRVSAPEAREALTEAGRRVAAIAAVHDILAVSPGHDVDMDDVLTRLVELSEQVSAAAGTPTPHIDVTSDLGEFPGDIAGPVAMAVSELLANAMEHAQATSVRVIAERLPDRDTGGFRIDVVDNGVGIEPDTHFGLGLTIVRSLIEEDLRGSVRVVRNADGPGTTAGVEWRAT